MLLTHVSRFAAQRVEVWRVAGTPLTVLTDADLPLGRIRRNIQLDQAARVAGHLSLPCDHRRDLFPGLSGITLDGRGYQIQNPHGSNIGLWESLTLAVAAEWTQTPPDGSGRCEVT